MQSPESENLVVQPSIDERCRVIDTAVNTAMLERLKADKIVLIVMISIMVVAMVSSLLTNSLFVGISVQLFLNFAFMSFYPRAQIDVFAISDKIRKTVAPKKSECDAVIEVFLLQPQGALETMVGNRQFYILMACAIFLIVGAIGLSPLTDIINSDGVPPLIRSIVKSIPKDEWHSSAVKACFIMIATVAWLSVDLSATTSWRRSQKNQILKALKVNSPEQ